MTFWQDGTVYFFLNTNVYNHDEKERNSFVSKLKKLTILDNNTDNIKEGKNSSKTIAELREDEFDEFIIILQEQCLEKDVR